MRTLPEPLDMSAIYDRIGKGYAQRRQPEPRIAAQLAAALGDARTLVNVGAGAGSYEPQARVVWAVEPSSLMIQQRLAGMAPCVRAVAEALPFQDGAVDAAMAVLTLHHWRDWRAGLREMRRVARRRLVILTFDVEATTFWLMRDYIPDLLALDQDRMPKLAEIENVLGPFHVEAVPIPHDCRDGFLGAYWRRPEIYLDPAARAGMSSFASVDARAGITQLAQDLASGAWGERYRDLLTRDALDLGYRLVRWELG